MSIRVISFIINLYLIFVISVRKIPTIFAHKFLLIKRGQVEVNQVKVRLFPRRYRSFALARWAPFANSKQFQTMALSSHRAPIAQLEAGAHVSGSGPPNVGRHESDDPSESDAQKGERKRLCRWGPSVTSKQGGRNGKPERSGPA